MQLGSRFDRLFFFIYSILSVDSFLFPNQNIASSGRFLCNTFKIFCNFLAFLPDTNPFLLEQERIQNFFNHYPGGTSFKSFLHLAQIFESERFQKFSYPSQLNGVLY
mmetsp:Transcript_14588/g.14213  ORF Transcript_14588/g.14213 Transcript_14588/m.14213 type:complete len:107 (-) Transcript_14588:273-593(-)